MKFMRNCGSVNGRQPDMVGCRGAWRCGVQVSVSTPAAKEAEAARDLALAFDAVLVVSTEPRKKGRIEKALNAWEAEDLELREKVTVISVEEALKDFDFSAMGGGTAC